MASVIRNKKAYDSGDVTIFLNGMDLDVKEITYDKEQEHQLNHSLSNDATSWSTGKKIPTASITLMLNEASEIERAAGGDMLSIQPFEINVTIVNDYNEVINDTIIAKFQNQGREITGDMGLNKQYTLFVLDLEFNNATI